MAGAGAAPPPVAGALAGSEDRYDGLIIDPERLPRSVEDFTAALDASLPAWREVRARALLLAAGRPPTCHSGGFNFRI